MVFKVKIVKNAKLNFLNSKVAKYIQKAQNIVAHFMNYGIDKIKKFIYNKHIKQRRSH